MKSARIRSQKAGGRKVGLGRLARSPKKLPVVLVPAVAACPESEAFIFQAIVLPGRTNCKAFAKGLLQRPTLKT